MSQERLSQLVSWKNGPSTIVSTHPLNLSKEKEAVFLADEFFVRDSFIATSSSSLPSLLVVLLVVCWAIWMIGGLGKNVLMLLVLEEHELVCPVLLYNDWPSGGDVKWEMIAWCGCGWSGWSGWSGRSGWSCEAWRRTTGRSLALEDEAPLPPILSWRESRSLDLFGDFFFVLLFNWFMVQQVVVSKREE